MSDGLAWMPEDPAALVRVGRPKPGSRRVFHVNTACFKSKITRLANLDPGQPAAGT